MQKAGIPPWTLLSPTSTPSFCYSVHINITSVWRNKALEVSSCPNIPGCSTFPAISHLRVFFPLICLISLEKKVSVMCECEMVKGCFAFADKSVLDLWWSYSLQFVSPSVRWVPQVIVEYLSKIGLFILNVKVLNAEANSQFYLKTRPFAESIVS